jgi:hypothetical protein
MAVRPRYVAWRYDQDRLTHAAQAVAVYVYVLQPETSTAVCVYISAHKPCAPAAHGCWD